MRFTTTIFYGDMMVHCHRLKHEDKGMMGIELVSNSS